MVEDKFEILAVEPETKKSSGLLAIGVLTFPIKLVVTAAIVAPTVLVNKAL